MMLFKEVADIKTADQLHLPTPEAHYETVVVSPSEYQKEMVQALSERAANVHSGSVDPSIDNMLKVTSDGRKLGLDQRLINSLLPDDPNSKVNKCVENIYRIWQEGREDKLTQLVFCDMSTPKTKGEKAEFSVYDDIRAKLIALGIPEKEIAFIHEAGTEVKKKELFAKVRSGNVRVLMGSTAKMGAGTNVQDRLVAQHDLDCPWRPGDLEQRAGRIVRQGNQNKDVHIYRYVTEGTFDAYLWQTVENKQKFISQIMTSKSPVRSCDDMDETALSYAEIKALCAGDPRIKEKMDLDVDVARLRLLKADHQSKQYRLEDNVLKHFPEQIREKELRIEGFKADMQMLAGNAPPEGEFAGMTLFNKTYADKDKAGEALLAACRTVPHNAELHIGSYRGMEMTVTYDAFRADVILTLQGEMNHPVVMGEAALGNLLRIENAIKGIPARLEQAEGQLENVKQQLETAKAELGKPFPQEEELRTKSARLAVLDAELDMDAQSQRQTEEKQSEKSSIMEALKKPLKDDKAPRKEAGREEER